MGIELNTQQVHALYDIENWWTHQDNQVYEISGAAGTGKTFLVNYFIDRIGLDSSEVAFTAFAGKAAMQMARNGLPAQTIHSLIYDHVKVLDYDANGKIQVNPATGKPLMKWEFVKKDKIFKNPKLIVVDEASMVNKALADDLLSFDVPLIALGDLNQLPPVIGNPVFLKHPNYILTQIMRQAENDPIVWLSQRILNNQKLEYGTYGTSSVCSKSALNDYHLLNTDIVLTGTNKLRHKINELYRKDLLNIRKLDLPQVGEKIICVKNDWTRSIDNSIFLMNGLAGYIDFIDIESYNGKELKIDFRPDFLQKKFKNIRLDYKKLFNMYGDNDRVDIFSKLNQFEFAYAITTHKSQGSQWDTVIYLDERSGWDPDTYKKLQYTAITRAKKAIHIFK